MKTFRGLFPPLITPFHPDGRLNEQGLRDHIDFVIANGADGFCGGSSTGGVLEAWSLDGLSTGTNGLLMTGAGYPASLPWTGAAAPAAATRFGSPAGMAPGDIAGYSGNGAASR